MLSVYILLFIAGAFLGSFLNLVSDRLPKGEKIVFGRSRCDYCKKDLKPSNLIPIFSFIIQKGKCSFCGKKLSFYYIFSEILTGLMFVSAGYLSGIVHTQSISSYILLFFYIITFSFFVTMFLTDLKFFLILDVLVLPAILFVFLSSVAVRVVDLASLHHSLSLDKFGVYLIKSGYWTNQVIYSLRDIEYMVICAMAVSLFFLFLVLITKGRGMGYGDVKLGFLIGLLNSMPLSYGTSAVTRYMYVASAMFLSFILGAIYSLFLILMKRKKMGDTIAFGPFLIMGSTIILLFGEIFVNWYITAGGIGTLLGI